MMCVDVNQDGKVDFNEFIDCFYNLVKDIGFIMVVLLINLLEYMLNDFRQSFVIFIFFLIEINFYFDF